jgi:hypothetical protein
MIIQTVLAPKLTAAAIDAMSACGDTLIDELQMCDPIQCWLLDQDGKEIGSFRLGDEAGEGLASCDSIEARLRSQMGASLKLRDARGAEAQVLLIIAAGRLQ